MTYVITDTCIDVKDKSCVSVCPVDCIYEGGRKLYINPHECVDCGACEPACPVDAIMPADDVPERSAAHVDDNALFFTMTHAGRQTPLGNPGGAALLGDTGVDTPLVTSYPT